MPIEHETPAEQVLALDIVLGLRDEGKASVVAMMGSPFLTVLAETPLRLHSLVKHSVVQIVLRANNKELVLQRVPRTLATCASDRIRSR